MIRNQKYSTQQKLSLKREASEASAIWTSLKQSESKAPSIHYYFRSKDALALALVKRLQENHGQALNQMNQDIEDPRVRLESVVGVFKAYVEEDKICLCGMVAAELRSVSEQVAQGLNLYFEQFEAWLKYQFESMEDKDASNKALSFLCALEGAVILARLKNNPDILERALSNFLMS